jgi:Leucine-rich repeat (LRR) protein
LDHWCNASSENEINKCDQEATLSQFDKLRKLSNTKQILIIHILILVFLASVLLEEVLHFVRSLMEGSSPVDHMKLKKQSFELLITPRLTNLDLSIGQLNDAPYILNLASLRCTVRDFRNFTIHDYKIIKSCLFYRTCKL